MIAPAVLAHDSVGSATDYCENINANNIVVGEARYRATQGPDQAYANAYWPGGGDLDELAPLWKGMGGTRSTDTDLRFRAYGYFEDDIWDCADVTFEIVLRKSDTVGSGCPSGYTSTSDTLVVRGCGSAFTDSYVVGKWFGRSGLPYRRYWKSIISVSGDESSATNEGCWYVYNENDCELTNY